MKNLKISVKLLVSFGLVTLLSAVLAIIGVWASFSINSDYTYLLDVPVERQTRLRDIQLQFTMMRYRTANYAMETGNNDIITGTLVPQYQASYDALNKDIDEYIKLNEEDSKRDSATISQYNSSADTLRNKIDQFKATSDNVRDLALSGDGVGATTALRDAITLANEVNTLIDGMLVPAVEFTNQTSADMDVTAVTIAIVQAVLAVICIAVSLIIALYISRQISRPIVTLTAFMNRAGSTGDLSLSKEDEHTISNYGKNKDETGRCINSTASFVMRLNDVAGALEAVAGGDLTAELALLSERDSMGLSLQSMVVNLNKMFGEINTSTGQVSAASRQIADGAQALAQGSTEQAASVQQLSASISEVADKTNENAKIAREAADLSASIKGNSEKGNTQMDHMMQAVKDINDASSQISKVIKVIDDIAFQTNILALNAAVEAARAGQHGKGFAVVAEEVRSLAAKSAAAAKDTGGMIESSIEKANLGLRIATETADSLREIVEGINRSTDIIRQIARLSDEQASAISQINTGIDQVAQVVQQNSATAEQSAAASEQMSGQSDVLEQLIAQFKLKDTGRHPRLHAGDVQQRRVASERENQSHNAVGIGDEGFGKY